MILYLESQLKDAYVEFVENIARQPGIIKIPTLEEFRPIYEAEMEELYHGQQSDN